jgi:glycosyltransferase involved in cell wall biosynthesis
VTGRSLHVAIVAANTFEYDSRLSRTAGALADDGHRVTVLGLWADGLPERERIGERIELRRLRLDRRVTSALRPLPEALRAGAAKLLGFDPGATQLPARPARGADRIRAPLRRALEVLAHARRVGPWARVVAAAVPDAHVLHCKALIALPVARGAAHVLGARFVYDIADIHTEAARLARMPAPVRWLVRRRERGFVRRAAGLTAVSDAVGREVARRFGVPPPVTVLNTPPVWRPGETVPPSSDRIRAATGIPTESPVVLYQGGFSVDRGIEELIAALDEPPLRDVGVAVVLLGYGRLRDALRGQAERRRGRLHVLDAVPPAELLEWTASADLSFVGQPPRTLNQRLNLANKLFESLMAGVPVLVATGTEHCRLVAEERVGACCDVDSPASIAAAAASLLGASPADRTALRARCRRAALERYSWERQREGLVELYRRLAASA